MKTSKIRQTICPILAALIWGTAFVAQSVGADYVGAFTFTAIRSLIGSIALSATLFVIKKFRKSDTVSWTNKKGYRKKLIVGGICCGVLLTVATNLQQFGISETSAGKAGFITALYIVLVPILGVFLHKKAPFSVWIGVIAAVAGLYLLCIKENFYLSTGDFYLLMCALMFAAHILAIDYFTRFVDGIELSCAQFIVVTIISSICMFIFEKPEIAQISQCIGSLLYVGIFSSGVAYTLQIIAQKDANPTVVSLLLSLESVFATIAGAIILSDTMSLREYIGCILMFSAVILAQLPDNIFKRNKKTITPNQYLNNQHKNSTL